MCKYRNRVTELNYSSPILSYLQLSSPFCTRSLVFTCMIWFPSQIDLFLMSFRFPTFHSIPISLQAFTKILLVTSSPYCNTITCIWLIRDTILLTRTTSQYPGYNLTFPPLVQRLLQPDGRTTSITVFPQRTAWLSATELPGRVRLTKLLLTNDLPRLIVADDYGTNHSYESLKTVSVLIPQNWVKSGKLNSSPY